MAAAAAAAGRRWATQRWSLMEAALDITHKQLRGWWGWTAAMAGAALLFNYFHNYSKAGELFNYGVTRSSPLGAQIVSFQLRDWIASVKTRWLLTPVSFSSLIGENPRCVFYERARGRVWPTNYTLQKCVNLPEWSRGGRRVGEFENTTNENTMKIRAFWTGGVWTRLPSSSFLYAKLRQSRLARIGFPAYLVAFSYGFMRYLKLRLCRARLRN